MTDGYFRIKNDKPVTQNTGVIYVGPKVQNFEYGLETHPVISGYQGATKNAVMADRWKYPRYYTGDSIN